MIGGKPAKFKKNWLAKDSKKGDFQKTAWVFASDDKDSVEAQNATSIAESMRNLRIDSTAPAIDTLILHSPHETPELTLRAWRAFEQYVPHDIRNLGISNVDIRTLKALYDSVKVKPVVVQSRFYHEHLGIAKSESTVLNVISCISLSGPLQLIQRY